MLDSGNRAVPTTRDTELHFNGPKTRQKWYFMSRAVSQIQPEVGFIILFTMYQFVVGQLIVVGMCGRRLLKFGKAWTRRTTQYSLHSVPKSRGIEITIARDRCLVRPIEAYH